jgi:hypothetical protein
MELSESLVTFHTSVNFAPGIPASTAHLIRGCGDGHCVSCRNEEKYLGMGHRSSPPAQSGSRPLIHTDGRTPWTSDQPIARPLPKHRATQTQNKHIHTPNIHALSGIRTHVPSVLASKISYALDRAATVTG